MRYTSLLFVGVLLLVSTAVVPGAVSAANNTSSQETPGELEGVVPDTGGQIQDGISSVLMELVEGLAEKLDDALKRIFVSYPDVEQQRVVELHQKVFGISLALASAAAVWIGVMNMFNRVDGIRQLIGILGAVLFGAAAPSLLWYPIELSRRTTEALAPADPSLLEVSRFAIESILVLVVDVFLLLGIVVIFIGRDVFLMLGVILAPLIALMAMTPPFRGYAELLSRIWIGCLLIGPLDVVVLDLTLSFMGTEILVPGNYLWGLGGIALLFGIPVIVLGAGVVAFAPLTGIAGRASGAVRPKIQGKTRSFIEDNEEQASDSERQESRRDRRNRFRRGGDG